MTTKSKMNLDVTKAIYWRTDQFGRVICGPFKVEGAKFEGGDLVLTQGVFALCDNGAWRDVGNALVRHMQGDWGDLDGHDRRVNQQALRNGHRLLSHYTVAGEEIYIITERDDPTYGRWETTVLLTGEY